MTLTATDDPSGRNVAGCPALQPLSTSVTVKVKAQIVYAGSPDGNTSKSFQMPFPQANKSLIVKRGSGFPVKFRLYDCSGQEICCEEIVSATIGVTLQTGASPIAEPSVTDAGAANDNTSVFRYSGTCGGGGNWIYNLKTNTSYILGATYKVTAYLNDGTQVCGYISIKP